jgi:hypothetical protein
LELRIGVEGQGVVCGVHHNCQTDESVQHAPAPAGLLAPNLPATLWISPSETSNALTSVLETDSSSTVSKLPPRKSCAPKVNLVAGVPTYQPQHDSFS